MQNSTSNTISVFKDFSPTPGSRRRSEGPYSGEDFRENIFEPNLKAAIANDSRLLIDLDETHGYGTSFIEEIFGGLIRDGGFTYDEIKKRVEIKSEENDKLLDEIEKNLLDARDESK